MIQFFRINDPFRIFFILLLVVLLRLPFFISGVSLSVEELQWLTVGEKLAQHGATLYQDVWTDIGPLSAAAYFLLNLLFGKTLLPYHIISVLLVVAQAFQFNQLLNRNDAYNEKTFIPGLLYALLMCWDVNFLTLSPVLMAMTFLLLVLRNTIRSDDPKDQENEFFKSGLYLGLASLFYFPGILFLPLAAFLFLLFRSFSVRSFLIMIYGVVMALIWPFLYFTYFGSITETIRQYYNFKLGTPELQDLANGLWLLVLPSFWLVFSFLRLLPERSFINFQVNVQRLFIIWFLGSVITLFGAKNGATFHLIIFVPVIAFFMAHYFLLIKRKQWLNLVFLFWLLGTVGVGYSAYYKTPTQNPIDYSFHLTDSALPVTTEKRIWVLSNQSSFYIGNQLASPYFNWVLAQKHLSNLSDKPTLVAISENLLKDKPEIIVDPNKKFPELANRIFWLRDSYARKPGTFLYFRNGIE